MAQPGTSLPVGPTSLCAPVAVGCPRPAHVMGEAPPQSPCSGRRASAPFGCWGRVSWQSYSLSGQLIKLPTFGGRPLPSTLIQFPLQGLSGFYRMVWKAVRTELRCRNSPQTMSPLSLGGAAASAHCRSHQVIPVSSQQEHPAHRSCPKATSDFLHEVAQYPPPL